MPARKAQLLLAAVFSSLLIAACNGDDAGSPASAAAANSSGNIDASSGADKPYRDPNRYSSSGSASLSPSAVTENAAITHHQITVNGKTINYTATAGHLSARNPQSGAAEASFFYVAYTADNQPLGKRPVTFSTTAGRARRRSGCISARSGPSAS